MGNETFAARGVTVLAGFFIRRFGSDFFFIIPSPPPQILTKNKLQRSPQRGEYVPSG
jgi:hypothetical protein